MTWRRVTPAAGPGYFLVGDAAAVLDPAASHGVLKAVMSGILAGHTIAQILHHQIGDWHAAHAYDRWMDDWFANDERRLRELYGPHLGLPA